MGGLRSDYGSVGGLRSGYGSVGGLRSDYETNVSPVLPVQWLGVPLLVLDCTGKLLTQTLGLVGLATLG